jgi:hypothetical protein
MRKSGKCICPVVVGLFGMLLPSFGVCSQLPAQSDGKEALIRATYAKLSEYNAAANAQTAAENKGPYIQADDLRFEIQNVRTGRISDIYNKSIGQMVDKPAGQVINVERAIRSFDRGPEHVMYRAKWVFSGYVGSQMEDWKNTSVKRMLQLTNKADVAEYASYQITVRLAGRKRTYRALALYRDSGQTGVEPRVEFLDNVVGPSALAAALLETRPPVKAPWLRFVKSDEYRSYLEAQKNKIANPEKKNDDN